jgi:Cupin domain
VLTWTIEGTPIDVGPGQALLIPRGAVHEFDNTGNVDAKALAVVTPASSAPTTSAKLAQSSMQRPGACPTPTRSQRWCGATASSLHPEMIASVIGAEPILRHAKRDISILVASEEVTIVKAQYTAGEQVAACTFTASTPMRSTSSRANWPSRSDARRRRSKSPLAASARYSLADGTELHVYGPEDNDHEFFGSDPVVGFVVDDAALLRRRMEEAGIALLTPLEQAGGSTWCHFRGPDGSVYEIISRDD